MILLPWHLPYRVICRKRCECHHDTKYDTFLKLSERCDIANEAEADYYVSLHRNTGEGYGVETWVYSGANEETMGLAGNIQQGLAGVGVQRDRDVKREPRRAVQRIIM